MAGPIKEMALLGLWGWLCIITWGPLLVFAYYLFKGLAEELRK